VFGGHVLYEWDIHLLWHTYARVFARTLAAGSWPLWNPWLSFGVPLLADANAQVLYPATWLHPFFAPSSLHGPLVVAHVFLSAAGSFLLFRRLGLSVAAAFAGAACWVASGPLLSLVYVFNMLCASALLPWVLLATERALDAPGIARSTAWGAALAVQLFAGSPDLALLTGLACAALVVRRLVAPAEASRRALALTAGLAFAISAALGAVQWVPALELARASARWGSGAAGGSYWSLHPLSLIEGLVPVALWRLPLTEGWREALFEARVPFLHSHYLGLPVVLLTGVGLVAGGPYRRFFGAAGILTLLFALGRFTPAHAVLVALLPPLGLLRFPEKAAVITAFAAAFLAGAGVDVLARPRPRATALLGAAAACVLAALAVVASLVFRSWPWTAFLGPAASLAGPDLDRLAGRTGLAAAGVLALGGVLLMRRRLGERSAGILTALIAIGTLAGAQADLNPTGPREIVTLRPAPLADLGNLEQARLWTFDYFEGDAAWHFLHRSDPLAIGQRPRGWSAEETAALAMRNALYPPSAAAFGVRGSYDSDFSAIYPRPLEALVEGMRRAQGTPDALKLLQLGAVTHVLALHDASSMGLAPVAVEPSFLPEPIRVFRVPGSLPRVRLVGRARAVPVSEQGAVVLGPEFDPAREVAVDVAPEEAAAADSAEEQTGSATIVEERPDRIRIATSAPRGAWLVQADTWDPGWRVTLDGQPETLLRANLAFRALPVPAGSHVVEEIYRPASVLCSAVVSALAWSFSLFVGLGAVRARSRRVSGRRVG
jgi:hypothetical protein